MTVLELVARERTRIGRVLAVWAGALTVAGAAAVLALGALTLGAGRWMTLPAIVPFAAWLLAVAAAVALIWFTVRHSRRDASTGHVAAAIESERRLRLGALRGALEVANVSALGRRGARDLAARLQAVAPRRGGPLAPQLRQSVRYRALIGSAIAALALASLGAAAVTQPDGWGAVIHPVDAWRGTLLPALHVLAPRDVPRGHEAHVRIAAIGRRRLQVSTRATGAAWTNAWYPVVRGAVEVTTAPVAAELAVVATDGRAISDTAIVRASDRPFVGGLAMRAVYPAYLHRAEEPLPAGEAARVPRGTRIEITGEASAPLAAIGLVHGRDSVTLEPLGRRFAGRLIAELPGGQWTWHAAAESGAITDVPSPLELDVIPDSAPHVDIVSPSHDSTITIGDHLPIAIAASDDHALASVQLRSWRSPAEGPPLPAAVQPVTDSAVAQWNGVVVIDLGSRGLEPGDALRMVAEATDGSPWHQTSVSRELILRVPSLVEQRTMVRAAADSTASAAAATASAQRQLQQRTEDAARARGSRTGSSSATSTTTPARSTMSYQSAEEAKALANQQRELANRVQQLQQQTKQLERQLKQAGALDSALSAELHQAQQLLNDALTPEMRDQLSKLDQSADSLRGGDTRQSLQQLAQQQQQMRAQLDRSVDILKRAALEGAMQTLHDEARDLAKEERARSGSPPNSTPNAAQRAQADARADSSRAARSGGDSARAGDSLARRSEPRPAGSEPQVANAQTSQPPTAPRQGEPRPGATPDASSPKTESQTPQGSRQSDAQLAERSRALSKDVDQLGHRLAEEKAETGAQQVGAAKDHVDSSTQEMSQRQVGKAASQMDRAAQQLGDARQSQIQEWKNALTQELDKSIQETMQLSRQESQLAQQAQQAQRPDDKKSVQNGQSAVQQGAERTGQRLQRASRQSALVSGNSQRSLGQARTQVENATRQAEQQMASGSTSSQSGSSSGQESGNNGQTAAAMRAAADALNQAAAAMMRDRERAASAGSASGLAEMLQEMQQLAKAQGSINSQAQGLSLNPGGKSPGGAPNASARAVAEGQRRLAESLDRLGDDDATGRAQGLAAEAHQIADGLARSGIDQQTLIRQQRLYHRLLDAGHTLEQDERDSTGKRVAEAATGREQFTPGSGPVDGRATNRYRAPSWSELRGLSADERQLVLEYFKRINAQSP